MLTRDSSRSPADSLGRRDVPGDGSRIDGIDVLRGLAIFFVLMNHVHIRLLIQKVIYGKTIPPAILHLLVWNGQYGVQIFFAISGFLITSMTLRRWGALSQVNIRDFYVLRFARIAPLLLLLLGVLSALHFARVTPFVVSPARGGLGRALFAALTFHINLLEAQKGYLPPNWDVLWSLSVEEAFYFVFPLACLWLGRGRKMIVLLAMLVLAGPFARTVLVHNEIWQEKSYLGSMDAIAMGCLTALLLDGVKLTGRARVALQTSGAVCMIFVLLFSVAVRRLGIMRAGLDMSIIALGTCLLILPAVQAKRRAIFAARPMVWLGRRSYEVYLTHMFVVIGLLNIFVAAGKPVGGIPLFFVGTAIFSGLLGELVARFYSEPLNRLLRSRWVRRDKRAAPIESVLAQPA